MAVMIENRTKNLSPERAPAVVVEGETNSDDTCEECGSCDESHDCQKGSHDNSKLVLYEIQGTLKLKRNGTCMHVKKWYVWW